MTRNHLPGSTKSLSQARSHGISILIFLLTSLGTLTCHSNAEEELPTAASHLSIGSASAVVMEVPGPFGPLQGPVGFKTEQAKEALEIPLREPLGNEGHLSFWFRTEETYWPMKGGPSLRQDLIEAPGFFSLYLEGADNQTSLLWRWAGENGREAHDLSIQLPGLPGPGWIHFAANWNMRSGVFDVFINGTPIRQSGTLLAPWMPPNENTESLNLHLHKFAFSGLRVEHATVSPRFIGQGLTSLYHGALDAILGARSRGPLEIASRKGDLIYANSLDGHASVENWVIEGAGIIEFSEGWMRMRSARPEGPSGHHVLWCDRDFPDRYIAQWEIDILKEDGLCIIFFAASGKDGLDLFDSALPPREGVFARYTRGDINTYHISYYANNPNMEPGRITSNMRKNHGAFLVDNGPIGIPVGSSGSHIVTLVKDGPHIMLGVDGRKIIDYFDDGKRFGPRLHEGKIGFRHMQWTDARYRNFRVYEID